MCAVGSKSGLSAARRRLIELMQVWERLRAFDPERGRRDAFVRAVLDNHAANLPRHRRARKRAAGATLSLDLPAEGDGAADLVGTLPEQARDRRRGFERRDALDQADLRIDVAAALAGLPENRRGLAEWLMSRSVTAVARQTGEPRTTVDARAKALCRPFEDLGLTDYLG